MSERDSYICSQYHKWFKEMGYPELDILQYEDAEWWIIQYYNRPIIPQITKWQVVLGPMRNMEISYGFIRNQVQQLDITKKAFWDREERKTREVEEEADMVDRHKIDTVNHAHKAITRNPALMERIAENGIKEMDLPSLERHVPKSEIFK